MPPASSSRDGLTHDEEVGYNIVAASCRSPLTMIAQNAGQDGGIVCERVLEGKGNFGYNALTNVYEDLVKAGVIDPTKVTRTALANAASVATLLLTSDALIAEKPKDDKHGKKRPRRRPRHVLSTGIVATLNGSRQFVSATRSHFLGPVVSLQPRSRGFAC